MQKQKTKTKFNQKFLKLTLLSLTSFVLIVFNFFIAPASPILNLTDLALAQGAQLAQTSQGTQNIQLAQGSLPLPNIDGYKGTVETPPEITRTDFGIATLAVGIVMNVRYVLAAVAIIFIIYSSFRLVTSQGNEELWTKAKTTITYSIVGLALVGLSGEIVRIFAVGNCAELGMMPGYNNVGCVEGGFLKDPNAIIQRSGLFNQAIQYIITFIKYLIGGAAVLMLMRNAIRMATNTAGEELEKDKKNIIASIIGLLLIIVADPIVNNVLFDIDTSRYPSTTGAQVGLNVAQGVNEIVGFTNFIVSILTPIAILVIVAAGVMYAASGGNEETQTKAKRMITLALIGLVIIYGAFAIVSTFISGQFEAINEMPDGQLPVSNTPINLN